MENILRIQQIEVKDFKNVLYGKVAFHSYKKEEIFSNSYSADILGLYGQNGSGKTTIVEGIDILKIVLSGEKLDKDTKYLLSYNTNSSAFKYTFTMQVNNKKYMVYYSFKLRCNIEQDRLEAFQESLKYADIDIENKGICSIKSIIEFNMDEKSENIFGPVRNYNLIKKINKDIKTDLIVSKKMAKGNGNSFIFNKDSMDIFNKIFTGEYELNFKIICSLQNYAAEIFVIKNNYLEHIDLSSIMPFNLIIGSKDWLTRGKFRVALFDTMIVNLEVFEILNRVIGKINIVLTSLIPGLALEINTIKDEFMENGMTGKLFELLSVRSDIKIPLKYESDGIKKIISIISGCIAMYNNERVCIVIDELDSGIFEFLLGELLTVLKENAKGQLIFTSHNLRALEVLDKNDIVFTTTNPKNRYIKLKNVIKTDNLRDVYLREIFLGEQNQPIYNKTKSYDISRTFRKAGVKNEQKEK
ncbi:AAA family ATPase [Clostridium sp. JS66]|uniref:AAA family ATPase n=1 Tax=Clostridium sp. JS66 TaxID=3064705 RepID=UPI00298DFDCE|nr:AAA family ATPase [Clostridium sp. JS66]WPC42831.1 AAA family ATPase [Clostridium sp. JS66]